MGDHSPRRSSQELKSSWIWLNKNTQSKRSLARVHIVLTRWLKLGRRWRTTYLLKGPCLVLVIEWQPRWTNMWLCEIHRWLVHRYMCMSNTCHDGEDGLNLLQGSHIWRRCSLHMRHDIESCDQGGEDQDKTWLNWTVASVKGKLIDDLARMDRSNSEVKWSWYLLTPHLF
jgi:hypothetical protein